MPVDKLVDEAGRLITLGVSEVACRLAIDSASFARAADNLFRAAGWSISAESLRKLVEQQGKLLLEAQRVVQLELDFSASDCQTTATPDEKPVSRIYLGSDDHLRVRRLRIISGAGVIWFGSYSQQEDGAISAWANWSSSKDLTGMPASVMGSDEHFGRTRRYVNIPGVCLYDLNQGGGRGHMLCLISYLWLIAALSSALPIWKLARWRACHRASRKGCCVHCGYDVRATPDRCPECGTVPTPKTA